MSVFETTGMQICYLVRTMLFEITVIQTLTRWKIILFGKLFCRLNIADDTGNKDIATLCDPNRPMKLAEKFGDLYDNEWMDAIDCAIEVTALYPGMKTAEIEEVIMRHLYQLVMVGLCFIRVKYAQWNQCAKKYWTFQTIMK